MCLHVWACVCEGEWTWQREKDEFNMRAVITWHQITNRDRAVERERHLNILVSLIVRANIAVISYQYRCVVHGFSKVILFCPDIWLTEPKTTKENFSIKLQHTADWLTYRLEPKSGFWDLTLISWYQLLCAICTSLHGHTNAGWNVCSYCNWSLKVSGTF